MRCVLKNWQLNRYPPHGLAYVSDWSGDTIKLPRNSSSRRIEDYGVGLLAGLVDSRTLLLLIDNL